MEDTEIRAAVRELVDKEHALCSRMEAGDLAAAEGQQELAGLEHSLDQCFDLLRQRRGRLQAGQNPDEAEVRDVHTVEGYRREMAMSSPRAMRRSSRAVAMEASMPPRRSLARPSHGPEARALLAFPWETTPIGPVDSWPDQLRVLVQVMLSSEFPMMIVWGPEYTQLYNGAFRPILGTAKHPGALGRSARETWAEIWDDVGPLFASVFAGETVWNTDRRLLINRNGYDEETHFTYSYSPIHDDSDLVAGLLVVATETTAQVIDRRRLSCMGDLARALVGATSIESVANVTIEALRDCEPATAIAIDAVTEDRVLRIASLPGHRAETTEDARIRDVAHSRRPVVLDEGWEPGRPASRVAFAIDHPTLRMVVTVATNPCRPFDELYEQFIDLLRATVSASMTAALVLAEELGALRLISDTLQHAMLELASDLPSVAARYLPKASNLTVGGDWYDVIDLGSGRRGLVVGDCVGHGVRAATAMGALRNVSRALLVEGRGPAEVIASLDRFATTMPAAECATVVCAVVDHVDRTITYSNAGHPPPLLVHDDQVVWLDQALATPLAVNEPTRVEARLDVRPGDLLVLYTDGLVERRNEDLDDGLRRLADAAVGFRDDAVEDVANQLIERLVGTTAGDDVALVVKRIGSSPAGYPSPADACRDAIDPSGPRTP